MRSMNFISGEGSSTFWTKAYNTSVHLQSVLAVVFPIGAVFSLVVYFVLAHGLQIWYTASFWILLSLFWALPPSFYMLYLFLLKCRSKKASLYELEDDDLHDYEREGLIVNEERQVLIREEEDVSETQQEIRDEELKEGNEVVTNIQDPSQMKAKKRVRFKLDFIAEGYVVHRFVPTIWNGMGISACIFGIIASVLGSAFNFLVRDGPGGAAAILTLLTAGSCMYMIIHRSVGVNDSALEQEMMKYDERHGTTRRRLIIAVRIVSILVGMIGVGITILSALQSIVYFINIHHYDPPGKLYDIGDSRTMHLNCNGTNGPTVIFLHGLGGQAYDWSLITPQISQYAKACTLDRTGYGWSDPPDCLRCARTADVFAKDMNALFLASKISKENILFVAYAEAIFDVQVFVNTYRNYSICGVVCVECMDTKVMMNVGPHATYGVPAFWDMWRNILPSGIPGLMAATGRVPKNDLIRLLPRNVHDYYIQNELKPKYPETVVMDTVYLPQGAQQASDAGGFGTRRLVVITAGGGLNQSGITHLSSNSSLIYVAKANHYMLFHEVFASIIVEQVRGTIAYSLYAGCAASP